jgi:uncharacterized HAD superfamily protein
MSNGHDYIPSREADLLNWAENFAQKVETHAQELEIPEKEAKALKADVTAFAGLFRQAHGPEATSVIKAKNTTPNPTATTAR